VAGAASIGRLLHAGNGKQFYPPLVVSKRAAVAFLNRKQGECMVSTGIGTINQAPDVRHA
jgi:hypothetical protein